MLLMDEKERERERDVEGFSLGEMETFSQNNPREP